MSENGWDSETADVLKGSVRRAIEIDDRPFDNLIFVELNFEYAAELSKIKHEYKERNIQIVSQDANDYLQNWCLSQKPEIRHTLEQRKGRYLSRPFRYRS